MFTGLAETVDFINESFLYNRPVSDPTRSQTLKFIQNRLGKPGSYAGMPAPTETDLKNGIRLFTGERPSPRSGRHILGEEACRALLILGQGSKKVRGSLSGVEEKMGQALNYYHKPGMRTPDFFCCPKCACGLWRHLSAGGLEKHEGWLIKGLAALKGQRDGHGAWKHFPFHYTLFTLLDIDLPSARKELEYSAKRCEKEAKRKTFQGNKYSQRRADIIKRVLGGNS